MDFLSDPYVRADPNSAVPRVKSQSRGVSDSALRPGGERRRVHGVALPEFTDQAGKGGSSVGGVLVGQGPAGGPLGQLRCGGGRLVVHSLWKRAGGRDGSVQLGGEPLGVGLAPLGQVTEARGDFKRQDRDAVLGEAVGETPREARACLVLVAGEDDQRAAQTLGELGDQLGRVRQARPPDGHRVIAHGAGRQSVGRALAHQPRAVPGLPAHHAVRSPAVALRVGEAHPPGGAVAGQVPALQAPRRAVEVQQGDDQPGKRPVPPGEVPEALALAAVVGSEL